MARQIQIRRGTASAHENFIGTIGEITMDTNENTLRVHDGKTPGGTPLARVDQLPQSLELPNDMDYVIESYSSDTYWYRKYKSGWIEQGGETGKGANIRTLNIRYQWPIPITIFK